MFGDELSCAFRRSSVLEVGRSSVLAFFDIRRTHRSSADALAFELSNHHHVSITSANKRKWFAEHSPAS